jgi:hypothetical protein
MTKFKVSLELRVVTMNLLHHSQAFLQNILLQSVFLVLVQIGILSDHIIRALHYLTNIARTAHPVLHHHSATVESAKHMTICDCAHPYWTIRWIDSSCYV